MLDKQSLVHRIVGERNGCLRDWAEAVAPSNMALVKYWGKRNTELNLPVTNSLSLSLGRLGSKSRIERIDADRDRIFLNGRRVGESEAFFQRISAFLDLFRGKTGLHFELHSENNIPTAAGLASSASGFAALILALNSLFDWDLERRELSLLARLGSGSSCRSLYSGFVEWLAGMDAEGMDSYARPFAEEWPDIRLGVLFISTETKAYSSRAAMKKTVDRSLLYRTWPEIVETDLSSVRKAIEQRDFDTLGATAESNALAMHALMLAIKPAIFYWLPETVRIMHHVWRLRQDGVSVYFTLDAGPNPVLLFLLQDQSRIREAFSDVFVVIPSVVDKEIDAISKE